MALLRMRVYSSLKKVSFLTSPRGFHLVLDKVKCIGLVRLAQKAEASIEGRSLFLGGNSSSLYWSGHTPKLRLREKKTNKQTTANHKHNTR